VKLRHRIGRAAVDMALGINLTPLSAPIIEYGNSPQSDIDRAIGIPLRPQLVEALDTYLVNLKLTNKKVPITRPQRLGRIATSIKWVDSQISGLAVDVISKLPGTASKEELSERDV